MKRSWWSVLVPVSLLAGLAESLAALAWGHVHWRNEAPAGTALRELGLAVLPGSLLCAMPVLLPGLILWGLAAIPAARSPATGPSRWGTAMRRLATIPTLLGVWIALLVLSSESPGARYVGAAAAALGIAGVLVGWPLERARAGFDRAWPALVAPGLALASWYAGGAGSWPHTSGAQERWVLLATGGPLLAVGFGWAVSTWRPAVGLLVGLAGLLGWGAWVRPAPTGAPAGDRPDVVLVVIDTLRADRVAGPDARMPNLAALAEAGTSFAHAYTVIPKTQQSVSTIMTGLYPWNHHVRTLHQELGEPYTTLAERFARAGYHTAAFVHNPWLSYGMGHEQGFAEYHDFDAISSLSWRFWRTCPVRILDRVLGRRRTGSVFQVDGRVMTDAVEDWLGHPPADPWFLWVHYFDPHWPYLPPAEAVGARPEDYEAARIVNDQTGRAIRRGDLIFHALESGVSPAQVEAARRLYDGEVRYVDLQLQRLLDRIPGDGSALVVVTADHGESLGEHGYFFHHGEYTYDDSLRIPLVAWRPGHVPAGRVVDAPVSTVDLSPTLLAMAGVEPGPSDGLPLPGLAGPEDPRAGRVLPFESDVRMFSQNQRIHLRGVAGKWRGVVQDARKLIVIPTKGDPELELYDLAADPLELADLHEGAADQIPPLLESLGATGLTPGGPAEAKTGRKHKRKPTSDETERLRALGYVD